MHYKNSECYDDFWLSADDAKLEMSNNVEEVDQGSESDEDYEAE